MSGQGNNRAALQKLPEHCHSNSVLQQLEHVPAPQLLTMESSCAAAPEQPGVHQLHSTPLTGSSTTTLVPRTLATASGIATAGPMPMMAGSTPTAEKLLKMPRIGKPRLTASARVINRQAAAPSVTCPMKTTKDDMTQHSRQHHSSKHEAAM
jgi:hypothetical protein